MCVVTSLEASGEAEEAVNGQGNQENVWLPAHAGSESAPCHDDEGVCDRPPPIDDIGRNEMLAIIREVFSSGRARERDQTIREVAEALGYRRLGSHTREALGDSLRTVVRRSIIANEHALLEIDCRAIDDYPHDLLVEYLLAAMGGGWWERADAITAPARHLGFRRSGKRIVAALKSAINAALRRGLLERDGPNYIRKVQ